MIRNKSIFKNLIVLVLAFALGIGTIIAPISSTIVNAASSSPAFAKTSYKVGKGYQVTLKINNVGKKVTTWQLNKTAKGLVTVVKKSNTEIVLKGKKVGKTVINAKVGGKAIKTTLEVKKTYVYLSKSSISMTAGDTAELQLQGAKTGTWSVTDKNILSLTKVSATKVKIKGNKAGTAKVKVKVDGKTYECNVTVKKKPAVDAQGLSGREYVIHKNYSGTSYEIDFKKGDISVKIKPILVNKSLADEFREEFNIPDSTKLYDQIEVSFTNNLNVNNIMVRQVEFAFGTKYCNTVYNDGSTKKQISENKTVDYCLKESDALKEGSYDYIFLNKGQTKTFRLIPYHSGVKFMSYGNDDPFQVNIGSFYDDKTKTLKGLSFLYFPATGETRETYMSEFSKNGYYCPYWPDAYH